MNFSLFPIFYSNSDTWISNTLHNLRGPSDKVVDAFVPYKVPGKLTRKVSYPTSSFKPPPRNLKFVTLGRSSLNLKDKIVNHNCLKSALAASSDSENKSVEDGVSLKVLTNHEGDGEYLGNSVREWLNNEWIEQDCHKSIGSVVKEKYIEGRSVEKINDLGEIMMYIGTELESATDFMEDAFVNEWDIVNYVSDLLMKRMDRELCSCSELVDDENKEVDKSKDEAESLVSVVEFSDGSTSTDVILNSEDENKDGTVDINDSNLENDNKRESFTQEVMTSFSSELSSSSAISSESNWFTFDKTKEVMSRFNDDFHRYDFLSKFLQFGKVEDWKVANIIMGLLLGYRYTQANELIRSSSLTSDNYWQSYKNYPPNFMDTASKEELSTKLEIILAEDGDQDKLDSLEDFLEALYGREGYSLKKQSMDMTRTMNGDKDGDFICRASIVKYIYNTGFVSDYKELDVVLYYKQIQENEEKDKREQNPFFY